MAYIDLWSQVLFYTMPVSNDSRHHRRGTITESDRKLFLYAVILMLFMIGFTLRTIYLRWRKFQSEPVITHVDAV